MTLAPMQKYFWRVTAINQTGQRLAVGSPYSFETGL
jgi:hypothetical protein